MITHKDESKVVETIEMVVCNRCGESMIRKLTPDSENEHSIYGLQASFNTGYLSSDFPDCQTHAFELCESCVKWLYESFKHPAKITDYM